MTINNKRKFITAALPYVNSTPHLGNLIGSILSADCYARYCRKMNQDVIFISGTDEYGTAIEIAAEESQSTPIEICNINYNLHYQIYNWFGIKFDYFGRTTFDYHKENVQKIFKQIYKNNLTETKFSFQLFCPKCEIFLSDRFLIGKCGFCGSRECRGDQCDACGKWIKSTTELLEPKCKLCGTHPEKKKSKHLFLKLDELKQQLIEFFNKKSHGWSKNAQEITSQWLKLDLHSRSITRDLKYNWGVPVPLDDFDGKVFYVWFDAPIAYFSFLQQYLDRCKRGSIDDWLKNQNTKIYQFMGKDNVPFHSLIFPGILISANQNFSLVDHICSTEYLTFNNLKFSKTEKRGVFCSELLENKFGMFSYWRYFLLRTRPEKKDSNFTFELLGEVVKDGLINNIGNLVHRILSFIISKGNSKIQYIERRDDDELFLIAINSIYKKYLINMENASIRNSVQLILDASSVTNLFIQKLFENKAELQIKKHGFSIACSFISLLGHMLDPIVCEISNKLFEYLNLTDIPTAENRFYPESFILLPDGHEIVGKVVPLFDPTELENMLKLGNR